jgi:hypothetical protein
MIERENGVNQKVIHVIEYHQATTHGSMTEGNKSTKRCQGGRSTATLVIQSQGSWRERMQRTHLVPIKTLAWKLKVEEEKKE